MNSYSGVVKTEVQFTAPRLFIFSHRVRDVRRGQGEGTGILPQERIAKLLRGCRIVLRSTEMHRHGSRGKEPIEPWMASSDGFVRHRKPKSQFVQPLSSEA